MTTTDQRAIDHPMPILQARQQRIEKLLKGARAAYHESGGRTIRMSTVVKMRQVLRDLIDMVEEPSK